jgi:lysozyme family protein
MTSRQLFDAAIQTVLQHEDDSFTDDPEDRGGATKFGVSARSNPGVDIRGLTREAAIEIYWTKYWRGQRYDELPIPIGTKTFDIAVNMGKRAGVLCLQRALLACGKRVDIDGILGPKTCQAASEVPGAALLAALRSEAAGEYRVILARGDADQTRFQSGWMNRAYS